MSSKKFKTLDGLTSTGNVAFGNNTLIVDVTTDRVGINKSNPQTALDIDGTVVATLFSGSGASLTNVNAATLGSLANTAFLRSNVDTAFSNGNFNFSSTGTLTFTNGTLRLNDNRTLRFGTLNTPGFSMSFDSTSKMIVQGFGASAETEIISAAGTSMRRATNTQPIKIQGNDTANNNTATITTEPLQFNRTFVIPNVANSSFIMSEGAQAINGIKTFSSTISGSINGNAATATTATTATTANALNTSNNYRINSLGVGTNASGTAGEILATNNITAFLSDERLKTFKEKIQSPLDKINALNGYHYELNELAESFGYSINKQYVGVSAQEVEAVLPEVVSLAPFDIEFDENGKEYSKSGENYKTVDYSKLVVLLIEGMKEQQNEIQQLKETVNQLKSILNK